MNGAETFVRYFVARLRTKCVELRDYGARDQARVCERIANDLEEQFRGWWLTQLAVSEAAEESGYSEERLREMAREGSLPHKRGDGTRGHITIARCDLPRRPKPRHTSVEAIEKRLLGPRRNLPF